ncbi:alanine racemase [Azorhizobium caulinodans]|uniref:alanine racemase n=1 Tax=Azorhizobium caulinodans TaxID=7 RepID=UPI002FBDA75F
MPEPTADLATLEIDLGAVRQNWRTVRAQYRGPTLGAVVKQNAYGFGLSRIVPLLSSLGCRDFWVVCIEEALAVRTLAPDARVFVLHGLAGAAPADFRAHRIIPVLMDASELPRVQAEAAARGPLDVAIQFDTGLSRLGLSRADVKRLRDDPSPLAGLRIAAYVTHLAHFSNPVARHNDWQWRRFRAWTQALPPAPLSFCASAGVFGPPERHAHHARVGSALYGVETTPSSRQPILPAARLTAPILRVMDVPAGTEVGYGGVYRTPQPARLAHVGVGYGGGLPFSFQRQAYGYVGGLPAPIVSGLAMSLMTLDVSGLPEGLAVPGAQVELFGPAQPVDILAAAAGVAPNVVMVSAGARTRRVYLEPSEEKLRVAR